MSLCSIKVVGENICNLTTGYIKGSVMGSNIFCYYFLEVFATNEMKVCI